MALAKQRQMLSPCRSVDNMPVLARRSAQTAHSVPHSALRVHEILLLICSNLCADDLDNLALVCHAWSELAVDTRWSSTPIYFSQLLSQLGKSTRYPHCHDRCGHRSCRVRFCVTSPNSRGGCALNNPERCASSPAKMTSFSIGPRSINARGESRTSSWMSLWTMTRMSSFDRNSPRTERYVHGW